MKAWITKYALTMGILEAQGEICSDVSARMFKYRTERSTDQYAHGEGKDWHRTPESALARAEVMRKARIASLRKSIAALEKMKFHLAAPNGPQGPVQAPQETA